MYYINVTFQKKNYICQGGATTIDIFSRIPIQLFPYNRMHRVKSKAKFRHVYRSGAAADPGVLSTDGKQTYFKKMILQQWAEKSFKCFTFSMLRIPLGPFFRVEREVYTLRTYKL